MAFVSVLCREEAASGASLILGKVCVLGAVPRDLGGNLKSQSGREADGERKKRRGGGLVFSVFPKRIKIGIRFLRG